MAIIDWYSRRVLNWRISNSMEAVFCVDCLEDALRIHGKPEIFNSDQGAQFTSAAFTGEPLAKIRNSNFGALVIALWGRFVLRAVPISSRD